jgi:catechol 2,3-dioxygenase-like lactoylglutathione lyase family enzyme
VWRRAGDDSNDEYPTFPAITIAGLTRKHFLTNNDAMTISKVQLLSVPVRDQDRSRDFYAGKLGLSVVADTTLGSDQRWVQVAPAGAETSVSLVTWFDSMPPGSLKGLVLETDDLDGEVARLRSQGISPSEVQQAPWGRFVTFDDPDGNGLILQTTGG